MAVENPPPLTPFAGEAPQRAERATFSPRVDKFVTWLIAVVLQLKMIILNVMHNANEAYLAASAAVGSQTLAASNASAAGAAAGEAQDAAQLATARALTAANAQAQAAGSASAAQADAVLAKAAAASVLAHGALAGIPLLGPTEAGKILGVNDAGDGLALRQFAIPVVPYADKNGLRALEGVDGKASQLVVRGLGLFQWVAGSTLPDDGETCFRTPAGAWELSVVALEYISDLLAVEVARTSFADRFLTGQVLVSTTSVAGSAQQTFTAIVPGVLPGDMVIATPPNTIGTAAADQARLSYVAWVSSADTVTVALRNTTTAAAAVTAATWKLVVIKQ